MEFGISGNFVKEIEGGKKEGRLEEQLYKDSVGGSRRRLLRAVVVSFLNCFSEFF